jgi:ribonuclease BN (tRNA processing enzyme)
MHLTVRGCAGAAPGPYSACPGYLVDADGYHLLLDLGAGAAGPQQQSAEPVAIDAAVISFARVVSPRATGFVSLGDDTLQPAG